MKKEQRTIRNTLYMIAYGLSLLAIILYIALATDVFEMGDGMEDMEFSADWIAENGKSYYIDGIQARDFGGTVILEKKLPMNITDEDSLCFESKNCDIKVWVEETEVYSFTSRANVTGIGYGNTFHYAGICRDDAGKTVRIRFDGMEQGYGSIVNVHVCPESVYIRTVFKESFLDFTLSITVLFFGIIMILIFSWMPDKDSMPFNLSAVGAMAVVLGIWFLLDTNIPQLLIGYIYVWRALSRLVIFLVGYPIVSFCNSLTSLRRQIYIKICFWLSVYTVAMILILRYVVGIDLIVSFIRFLIFYVVCLVAIIAVMAVDNARYCREQGIKSNMPLIYVGMAVLIVCGIADVLRSAFSMYNYSYILFTRAGTVIFIIIMLFQFLKWWVKDHSDIQRDRFINRTLQYAVTTDTPDIRIKLMLEYMGKEMGVRHAFIIEDQSNGKFRGTYEWVREGEESAGTDLMYLPYSGLVDLMYDYYRNNNNRLIVVDPEPFRTINPGFYNILKTNNVDNMILNPIEFNNRLIGFLGVTGAPSGLLEDIAEILKLISFFIAQLITQRKEQGRLFFYSYNDTTSRARNRRAYKKFTEDDMDMSSAFGYVKCEIEGLELTNSALGYEAGDKLVKDTAKGLMDVFGEENVYRLSGSEFVAFGFESEELYFYNDVERAKKLIVENDIRVRTGAVFCTNGTTDLEKVARRAEELLTADGSGA